MELWLDDGKTLIDASRIAGVDPKTVRRRIPVVLKSLDSEVKRKKWEKMIAVLEND